MFRHAFGATRGEGAFGFQRQKEGVENQWRTTETVRVFVGGKIVRSLEMHLFL